MSLHFRSFIGYSNANYALSEVRDPVRTIKRAAPLAMLATTLVYMLVNVAYFAVVSKSDILNGGRIVAALFFRNLFGPKAERVRRLSLLSSNANAHRRLPQLLSAAIAISVFGNIMSVLFTAGRVVQELGREGVLPYSAWFSSNRPFDAPFVGLFWQYVVCAVIATAPPPGDAFNFILNLSSYPMVLINVLVAAGLLFLHTPRAAAWAWAPPFKAWIGVTAFFLLSNVFLAVVPLVPPAPGYAVYEHLPYWLHVAVSLAIGGLGVAYWYAWFVYLPRKGGYVLVRAFVLQEDGVSRNVYRKIGDI